MIDNDLLWQTKLAARIHDPAEKALVLLRDPAGHEDGTSRALRRLLGFDRIRRRRGPGQRSGAGQRTVQKRSAAGDLPPRAARRLVGGRRRPPPMADGGDHRHHQNGRPEPSRWPTGRRCAGQQAGARDIRSPATQYDLGQTRWPGRHRSQGHQAAQLRPFLGLLARLGAQGERRKTCAKPCSPTGASARICTEDEDFGKLGALWRLLPADTRVPTIASGITSISPPPSPAPLPPIRTARRRCWRCPSARCRASSRRRARWTTCGPGRTCCRAWPGRRCVRSCEALGPDAILFPRLRGIPQVDLWLRDDMGLDLPSCSRAATGCGAAPTPTRCFPRRCRTASWPWCPASQARAPGGAGRRQRCGPGSRPLGKTVVDRPAEEAGMATNALATSLHCYDQMRDQLAGFPEVHWAAVPFSLIRPRDAPPDRPGHHRPVRRDGALLRRGAGKPSGFLASPAWQVLQKETTWERPHHLLRPEPRRALPGGVRPRGAAAGGGQEYAPFDQSEQTGLALLAHRRDRMADRERQISRRTRPASARAVMTTSSGKASTSKPCGPRWPTRSPPGPSTASTWVPCPPSSGCGRPCSRRKCEGPEAGRCAASSSPPTPWRWPTRSTNGSARGGRAAQRLRRRRQKIRPVALPRRADDASHG